MPYLEPRIYKTSKDTVLKQLETQGKTLDIRYKIFFKKKTKQVNVPIASNIIYLHILRCFPQ